MRFRESDVSEVRIVFIFRVDVSKAMQFGESLTFRRNILPSSSESKCDLEDHSVEGFYILCEALCVTKQRGLLCNTPHFLCNGYLLTEVR
jgi:hypothetical protein